MEKLRPEQLREKANMLPLLPGVYIMLDEHGEVIYIGKAKALKNRVTSYFRGEHLPKVAAMVAHVADFNVIVVQSEFEALVLENSLIKLHKPKYNILLKDDKGYPFVRLDVTQPYPTFSLVNRTEKDGAKYFGPYGGRSMTAEIIDTVCKTLRLPTCTRRFPRDIGRARPCLNYHMGTCAGYCLKDVTRAEYLKAIREAEAYDGPSIVICYCPCIEHGMKASMGLSQIEEKKAVECGYWHLYRYDPRRKEEGKNPFQLDSKAPTGDFQQFLMGENRYASLKLSFPEKADALYHKAANDAKERYEGYVKLAKE